MGITIPKPLRYLRILHYLSVHSNTTINDLFGYFDKEISIRNLQRDLKALMKFECVCIEKKTKGKIASYHIPKEFRGHYRIPIQDREIDVIRIAQEIIQNINCTELIRDTELLVDKINQWVEPQNEGIEITSEIKDFIVLGYEKKINTTRNNNYVTQTFNAIRSQLVLKILYKITNNSNEIEIDFCPLKVLFYKHYLYVIGFKIENEEKIITLRFDRICKLVLSSQKFVILEKTSLKLIDRLNIPFGLYYDEKIVKEEVEILFKNKVVEKIQNKLFHATQKITDTTNETITIVLNIPINSELIKWILSFGENAEVVRPVSLRDKISMLASNILRIYSKQIG